MADLFRRFANVNRHCFRGFFTALAVLVFTPSTARADECVDRASARYGIPSSLIHAVLKVEGGEVGQFNTNTNGTEDIGPMQINSVWLPTLEEFGISREQLLHDRCINIFIGSWILSRQLLRAKQMPGPLQRRIWWGVGAYHSRTPELNVRYATRVWEAMQKLSVADMR
ncbi:MAG: lytic transglycosylase domain-containing protein [bacterium]